MDLTSSGGWSAGDWSLLEMAQQLLAQGESILMLALLDTIAETADDPNWADKPGMEYGLDLSLEELSRLGPDGQLPYLWQHALKLGLIDSSVPMQVAHQVLDDLKRIFHHHMTLDRPLCRPSLPRPDHPDPTVRCAGRRRDHARPWLGTPGGQSRRPFRPRPAPQHGQGTIRPGPRADARSLPAAGRRRVSQGFIPQPLIQGDHARFSPCSGACGLVSRKPSRHSMV